MPDGVFKLDLSEPFPRLAHAPIVEAVIHWQARSQNPLDPDALRAALAHALPAYGKCEPIQQIQLLTMFSGKESAEPVVRHQQGWEGFRLTSNDGRYVLQFKRDGIVFSRLHPYEHWESFCTDAMKAWQVFRNVAAPVETQRLGVRFINHLPAATPEKLGEFLREPPTCPSNLPLKEFVYQSTFEVPEHPFGVRVIKLMQPPGVPQSSGLFVDCDVFTTRPIDDNSAMNDALVKMRWLKNKFFFTLLTDQAIESFR